MNLQGTRRDELTRTRAEKPSRMRTYGLFALGIVPVYTFLFACQGDLLATSLSRLGNRPGYYGRFVLWGIVCTGCLFVLFHRTFAMARYRSRVGRGLMCAACASFLICVLMPFVPDEYPRMAKWHNDLALMAAVLTVAVSLLLSLHLRRVDRALHRRALLEWAINFGVCFRLLQTTGVTSLLEALYIVLTGLHTYGVMARLDKGRAAQGIAA